MTSVSQQSVDCAADAGDGLTGMRMHSAGLQATQLNITAMSRI